MSRAERRSALQRAYAAKQERLLDAAEKLATRENHFHIFQQERAVLGTAAMIMELNHGENAFCFPGSSTRAFSEALRPRLTRQSYEAAVTGALRDALEIDNLRNTIVTLKATSTERYAQFL